ncbi:MAG: hypothetical protein A2622_00660 [Bdellovibrionales bacterium RIFCSPHIGHO2_01_FULL_40_29]|nr:MAG: hypothetical protein A2622_00660 [Bdellovibrionales bacterium RIFCSPHIGHO2_01_FULL_40_29]OFZ32630.1 MAG: hypothetical protein A3D17_05260 [Bdellovibrionales bacterium RIFCSPHIGHO2_02_FULL_40_15]
MFYSINQDPKNGLYYVSPTPQQWQSQFLIQCHSKMEAIEVIQVLCSDPINPQTPINHKNFKKFGFLGETEVYVFIR